MGLAAQNLISYYNWSIFKHFFASHVFVAPLKLDIFLNLCCRKSSLRNAAKNVMQNLNMAAALIYALLKWPIVNDAGSILQLVTN